MMEEIVERENLKGALRRVKANKGAPGVGAITVNQLDDHLKQHWPAIREQLLSGTYRPKPVKRVEIPKPDGGVRKLGIPNTAGSGRGPWYLARSKALSVGASNAYFRSLGLPSLFENY
jgi:hypothetical protein